MKLQKFQKFAHWIRLKLGCFVVNNCVLTISDNNKPLLRHNEIKVTKLVGSCVYERYTVEP